MVVATQTDDLTILEMNIFEVLKKSRNPQNFVSLKVSRPTPYATLLRTVFVHEHLK